MLLELEIKLPFFQFILYCVFMHSFFSSFEIILQQYKYTFLNPVNTVNRRKRIIDHIEFFSDIFIIDKCWQIKIVLRKHYCYGLNFPFHYFFILCPKIVDFYVLTVPYNLSDIPHHIHALHSMTWFDIMKQFITNQIRYQLDIFFWHTAGNQLCKTWDKDKRGSAKQENDPRLPCRISWLQYFPHQQYRKLSYKSEPECSSFYCKCA